MANEQTNTLKLAPETYTLHEVQAQEGYKVVEDIVFTVNDDGTISVNDEIVNAITMIDLKLEKEQPENPDDNNN